MRGDQGRAGAGAAGGRDAGAALPHPQPQPVAGAHLRHADIGALRETADRARARGPAPRDRSPRHRRRRRSRADCPYWCTPDRRAAPAPDRGTGCRSARASGMSRQAIRAGPISTVTCPSAGLGLEQPGCGLERTAIAPLSRLISKATQRAALPHASASPPSALRMRMKAAPPARRLDDDELIAADAGWRSAMARAAAASIASRRARASSTTKSLPSPCIFTNGTLLMAPLIWRGHGSVQHRVQHRPRDRATRSRAQPLRSGSASPGGGFRRGVPGISLGLAGAAALGGHGPRRHRGRSRSGSRAGAGRGSGFRAPPAPCTARPRSRELATTRLSRGCQAATLPCSRRDAAAGWIGPVAGRSGPSD